MKRVAALLFVLLLMLQYRLWAGQGGLPTLWHNESLVAAQSDQNAALEERNKSLEGEVRDLKHGLAAVEERARTELGMIKKGETFFQIIGDPEQDQAE